MRSYLLFLLKISVAAIASLPVLIVLGTFLNLASYRNDLISPFMLPIPSGEEIGRAYLLAVIQQDFDHIRGKNQVPLTKQQNCSHQQLLRDIEQYGSSQVRNIVVTTEFHSGNSDHQFEVTLIRFKYRISPNNSWQASEIRLMTATNLERGNTLKDALPFRRIFCGGTGF